MQQSLLHLTLYHEHNSEAMEQWTQHGSASVKTQAEDEQGQISANQQGWSLMQRVARMNHVLIDLGTDWCKHLQWHS